MVTLVKLFGVFFFFFFFFFCKFYISYDNLCSNGFITFKEVNSSDSKLKDLK